MSPNPIPESARRVIVEAINSVVELEALLLLRAMPERRWTDSDVGTRLYVGSAIAGAALAALTRHGFLADDPEGYAYRPTSQALADDVSSLAAAYSTNLISVTQLIHAKPSASVQDFARAFRIRKER